MSLNLVPSMVPSEPPILPKSKPNPLTSHMGEGKCLYKFRLLTKRFSAVVKTHKHRSKKIYKTELTKIKI